MGRSPGTTLGDAPVGTGVLRYVHQCPHSHLFLSCAQPPPHTYVPPSSFPSVVCWTQYHTLQFTDNKVRLRELCCPQKSLMWNLWWAHALSGHALSLVCAHEPPAPPAPRLTDFSSTLDTRRHQFDLGKCSQNWSLAGRAVLLV